MRRSRKARGLPSPSDGATGRDAPRDRPVRSGPSRVRGTLEALRGLLVAALLVPAIAGAHALGPSLLEIEERGDGEVAVVWKKPAAGAAGASHRPALPERCRSASEPTVGLEGEAVVERWTADCGPGGLAGSRVGIDALATSRAAALVRVGLADGSTFRKILTAEEPFVEVAGAGGVFPDYFRLGVEHIFGGFDHLLFVLGLVLLVSGRRLLWTVTAFTLGHSVTLALAVLGFVNVPQAPVEAAIAATILALAVEIARGPEARPGLLRRHPPAMAVAFGLLHGLGFAGALAEVGLPPGEIPLALLAFNVGIEAGQIAFVLAVLAAATIAQPLAARVPAAARLAPAYTIGALAAYWTLERLAAL